MADGGNRLLSAAICMGLLILVTLSGTAVAVQARPTEASSSQPTPNLTLSTTPPMGTGILKDPTGTYVIHYIGNGQISMNLTAYERLLADPDSGLSATVAQIAGGTVTLNIPSTINDAREGYPTTSPATWSGVSTGNRAFSISGAVQACPNPTHTLQTSGASAWSLTRDGGCWGNAPANLEQLSQEGHLT